MVQFPAMSQEKLSKETQGKFHKLPIGLGKEFLDERKKDILPAIEVKNEVIWINPAFEEAPFDLKEGQQTKLGMFFTPKPAKHSPEDIRDLMVMPETTAKGRSGMPGSVIFRDREGRLYRDIDMKGIGLSRIDARGKPYVGVIHPTGEEAGTWGIVDYEDAVIDRDMSEKFLAAGIRTHRVVAIIKLLEIVDETDRKVTIKEARGLKFMLPADAEPVVVVRAFGTKERIGYLGTGSRRAQKAFEDARMMVAQELGKDPKEFSAEEYLEWFAKTLGSNVARIHRLKLYHGYLTTHNITLDAHIVDLDSVVGIEYAIEESSKSGGPDTEKSVCRKDYFKALDSFDDLMAFLKTDVPKLHSTLNNADTLNHYRELLRNAYQKELNRQN